MSGIKSLMKLHKLLLTKESVMSDYFTQDLLDVFDFTWVDGHEKDPWFYQDGGEWQCKNSTSLILELTMGLVALPYFDDLVNAMRKIIVEVPELKPLPYDAFQCKATYKSGKKKGERCRVTLTPNGYFKQHITQEVSE